MNITHWRYALEVEKTRSISKAAQNLFMGQPNISRAIKELEENLGITLFTRTPKGIDVTTQGAAFLNRARRILAQIDEVEELYRPQEAGMQRFSISVPRASYIGSAFTSFVQALREDRPAEIYYKETNVKRALENMVQEDYRLSIIRYQTIFEQHFRAMLKEKNLLGEVVMDFNYLVLVSAAHPLAGRGSLELSDLYDCIEIAHADPYVPALSASDVKRAELSTYVDRHIYVYERASQFDLLQNVPNTFMWVSPIPARLLAQYSLVQIPCHTMHRAYRDLLIYRNGYNFTELDSRFLDILYAERDALPAIP